VYVHCAFKLQDAFPLMTRLGSRVLTVMGQDGSGNPHSLLPFLQRQSQGTLTRLYQSPSSCLSIFRSAFPRLVWTSLTSVKLNGSTRKTNRNESLMARRKYSCCHYGILGVQGEETVCVCTLSHLLLLSRKTQRYYDTALKTLSHLHILPTSAIGKLALNTTFKGSMRAAIVAGCVPARSKFCL
jgi:transcription initiation factor TFIIH subunit 4